ncbi:hypothetical protein EDB85DRAFT_1897075 [Lactarius pseudohatsudake]|nr:hypothetical protein EDB85DRAFT_1897075 [Lactarius pseudohatsudake]
MCLLGKVIIVTRARSTYTTQASASMPQGSSTHVWATVYSACWSHAHTHMAMTEVEGEVGAAPAQSVLRFFQLELAPLYATKAAAEAFARGKERLHILSSSQSS